VQASFANISACNASSSSCAYVSAGMPLGFAGSGAAIPAMRSLAARLKARCQGCSYGLA
jgi:hypothetical protein